MRSFLRGICVVSLALMPAPGQAQQLSTPAHASLSELVLAETGRPRFGKTPVIDRDSARRVLVAAAGEPESRALDILSRAHPTFMRGLPRRANQYTFGTDTSLILLSGYVARSTSQGTLSLTRIDHDRAGAESRLQCVLAVRRTAAGQWSRDSIAGGPGGVVCLLPGIGAKP